MSSGPRFPPSPPPGSNVRALSWSLLRAPESEGDACEPIRQEVAELFVAHRDEIHRYLVHTRCRDGEAEEIAQEVFIRLYRARLDGTVVETPRSWLYAVARNIAIDRMRRRRQERLLIEDVPLSALELPAAAPTGEEALLAEDRRAALAGALGELTDLQRDCLHLRAHGLSLREIGTIVGVSVWGVSDAVRRAIRRLQKEIDVRA